MQELDLDGLQEAPERWIDLGEVGFQIRYASPTYGDTFRRVCHREGIGKMVEGRFEVNLGREKAYYRAIASHYVCAWRGVKKGGQEIPYDPDSMATLLACRGDALKAIVDSIGEHEAFFGKNGSRPT